jgi:hypothetical protein
MAKNTEKGKTKTGALVLPDGFDPKDMALKKTINPEADELNQIAVRSGVPVLVCGAMKHGKPCKMFAGQGTDHVGRGRCHHHGGASTGPATEEGKAVSSKNSTLHGLYSSCLFPWEVPIFEQLVKNQDTGLTYEIYVLKTKIVAYLNRFQVRALQVYQDAKKVGLSDEAAKEAMDEAVRVWASFVSEDGNAKGTTYYHAGTPEDRALDRSLRTLSNLIKTQVLLNPDQGNNLLNQINEELKAASFGRVQISWGGKAPAIGGAQDGKAAN